MSELPAGFVLDQPVDTGLPPGFVIDQPGALEDAAKSAGAGLGSMVVNTLGGGGDLRQLASHGVDAIAGKLGVDPTNFKKVASTLANFTPVGMGLNLAPTSQDIKSTIDNPIVSPDYEPKTALGGVLKTGAEFLPAMIGGPEGVASKLLTRVAVPALASEGAGALTKGTAAEPYARAGAALLGGVGASVAAQKFKAMAAARNTASATPTAENLLSTAGKQFEDVKSSDLVIKPAAVENMAKDIKTELLNDGFHPDSGNQKGVFGTLDRLEAMGTKPGGVTPKDMEVIRKNLVSAKTDIDGSTAKAARDATNSFMDKYSNLGMADVLNGDAQKTFGALKDAIGNYAAGKRSNTVTGKVDLAKLNADTAGSGANQDNALRQAIKQLARPINNTNTPVAARLGFNKEEVAAIRGAATGTTVGNTARYLGKYAPTGIVSAAGGAGLGHLIGGPVGAAIPVAGYIAKKIGDLSTKRAVAAVDSLVRSRSPLAAQVAAQLSPTIVNQLPAKSQQILRTIATQQPTIPAAPQRPAPIATPAPQAVATQRPFSMPIPSQPAPIFAQPKITPQFPKEAQLPRPAVPTGPLTAADDGQPSRLSRAGLGENIRSGKYQDWTEGRIVKVGFVDGLKVHGTVPSTFYGEAPGFVLSKGDSVYIATPHKGMVKLSTADGKQALRDARPSNSK